MILNSLLRGATASKNDINHELLYLENCGAINEAHTIIFWLCNEQTKHVGNVNATLKTIRATYGHLHLKVVVSTTGLDYSGICMPTLEVPWFLLVSKFFQEHHQIPFNTKWSPESKKALYLPGKITSRRVAMLYEAYTNHRDFFDNQLTYSLMYDENEPIDHLAHDDVLKSYNLNENEISSFLTGIQRELDVPLSSVANNGAPTHYTGYPFDLDLYRNTSFSWIVETDIQPDRYGEINTHWLTEKTWRAIANYHPFILLSSSKDANKVLEDMGFVTFYDLHQIDPNCTDFNEILEKSERFAEMLTYSRVQDVVRARLRFNQTLYYGYANKGIKEVREFCGYTDNNFMLDVTYKNLSLT